MDTGYIKLYRKILDNPISSNLELVGLLAVLLLKANHKANSFFIGAKKINVNPGQFVSSQMKLALEFGISRMKIIRLLKILQDEKIVNIKGCSKYSLFTVINRNDYQNVNIKGTSNDTTSEHQVIQQVNTNKNDKNDKNEKKRGSDEKNELINNYIKINEQNIEELKKVLKDIIGHDVVERNQYRYATLFELMRTGLKVKQSRDDIEKNLDYIAESIITCKVVGVDGSPLWEKAFESAKKMRMRCFENKKITKTHMSRFRKFLSDHQK